jgi:hypothetical protein
VQRLNTLRTKREWTRRRANNNYSAICSMPRPSRVSQRHSNQTQIVDPTTQNLDPPSLPEFTTSQDIPFLVPQVPEPSTWALMMAGALGLGAASLRRHRRIPAIRHGLKARMSKVRKLEHVPL